MATDQLYPEVIDASTLKQKVTQETFLPIGIEGQANGGTAVVGTPTVLSRLDSADAWAGAATELSRLIKAIITAGAGPVVAIASINSGTAPTLVQRQAAWEKLESDELVRIRLTDSTTQADLAALADSCENADLLYNKQFAIVGLPSGTSKANLITGAAAVNSTRGILVGPGIYDATGTLRSGAFAAAVVAAEVAKNSDPSNDLDLWPLPFTTGIEKGADGLPVFRKKVVTGAAVNDFEDLLQGEVSPLMPAPPGEVGARITHLRMTETTSGAYDSLSTRIIVDQVFIDVRDYLVGSNFLRMGNTQRTRDMIKSGVEALLNERSSWVEPVEQGDGSLGYNVSVTPSADRRQVTVGYEGTVVRGISTIQIAASLTIPV